MSNVVHNTFQFNVDLFNKINIIQKNNKVAQANLELIDLQSSFPLKYVCEKEKLIAEAINWTAEDIKMSEILWSVSSKHLVMFVTK